MDTIALVESQIDDGWRLSGRLVQDNFPFSEMSWIRAADEDGRWSLWIATPVVDHEGSAQAYSAVYRNLRSLGDVSITASDIKLISQNDPVAKEVREVGRRHVGRVPAHAVPRWIGGMPVEDLYVYTISEGLVRLFHETKQRFPNAEIFTISVPATLDVRPFMNKVNSDEFQSRAPETLLLVGPQGSSEQPLQEVVFFYRPEGWNTLYRKETGSWERVQFKETGKPLYEAVDFTPLIVAQSLHE